MSFGCPLHTLCHQRLTKGGENLTPYQRAVQSIIGGEDPDLDFLSQLQLTFDKENQVSPKELIDRWYALLGGSLLACLSNKRSTTLQNGIRTLSRVPFWDELQLISALQALNQQLLGMKAKVIKPIQLENGAVAYQAGGHWPWADVPYSRFQAELGVLWCILGVIQEDPSLIDAAMRLAMWQKNTLDFDGTPLTGLFNTEADASETLQLIFNYLLFRAVASAKSCRENAALAKLQVRLLEKRGATIPFVAILLEQWLDRNMVMPEEGECVLDEYIVDPKTPLIGVRSKDRMAFCTLSGGNTGLGVLRHKDAQIVNYGPQHLPLGDCNEFGIESGIHGPHASELHSDRDGFFMKRGVRLVSKQKPHLSAALYQIALPSGVWIDVKQHFQSDTLSVGAKFIGYEPLDSLAFIFYAKGVNCLLSHGELIKPKSLDRYQGRSQPLSIQGHQGTITIIPDRGVVNMQVIPLAGGESFWGADFLISYQIDSETTDCQWKISL